MFFTEIHNYISASCMVGNKAVLLKVVTLQYKKPTELL